MYIDNVFQVMSCHIASCMHASVPCLSTDYTCGVWDFVWTTCPLFGLCLLSHWGRVTHICVSKLTIIGSDNDLSPGRRSSHYLNQCWNIVNWTLRNKLQWNLSRNSNIFFQKNALENVVCVIASISSRPQWVNNTWCVRLVYWRGIFYIFLAFIHVLYITRVCLLFFLSNDFYSEITFLY